MSENFTKLSKVPEEDNILPPELQTQFQQINGSLMYAVTQTRLDLIIVLSKLSQFNVKATDYHIKAISKALQYVRSILNCEIIYSGKAESDLKIYSNTDFANDSATRRSTSEYVVMFANGFISDEKLK